MSRTTRADLAGRGLRLDIRDNFGLKMGRLGLRIVPTLGVLVCPPVTLLGASWIGY